MNTVSIYQSKTIVFIIALFSLPLISIASATAQIKKTAIIPKTPVGSQLANWQRIFESGDQIDYARFVGEQFSKSLIEQQGSPVYWADRLARNFADTRGYEIRQIENSTEREIAVLAKARLTGLWYRLSMKVETNAPYLIAEYAWQRIRPPAELQQQRSSERNLLREIRSFMSKLAAADAFSGTVLVAKDGKPVFKAVYGLASKAYNIPNRFDTKFNIASIGKNFTAIAVMQLIEQGKLSLTDTVGKFLPDYPNKDVREKVTIHNLLSHSSGLGDFHGPKYVARKNVLRQVKDYLPLFDDMTLSFEPGKQMQYSNVGYILLGAVIEKTSGQNYFDYVRSHIFKPSGMTNTDYYEADIDALNLATGYTNFEDLGDDFQVFHLGQRRNTSLYNPVKGNPQGGAYSTVEDLLRYTLALRDGRLISVKSLDLMTTQKYSFRKYGAGDIFYGYGFEVENIGGKRVIGHGGGDLGISSVYRWYPDSGNYTVVILSNYDRGGIIAIDKLQEMIVQMQK